MSTDRPRIRPAIAASLLILGAIPGLAHAQQGKGVDPERAFAFGDTDLDGVLKLDEFRELLAGRGGYRNPAAKKAVANPEALFRRLDADGNGSLTLKEYRQMAQLRAAMGAAGGMGPTAKAGAARKAAGVPKTPKAKATPAGKPITAEQSRFFEAKIRPVLATKCAQCHAAGAEKIKGGLVVDTREGLRKGGDTGPAIVPGDLDASLLIAAIRHGDDAPKMPPKAKLPDEVIADFEAWVTMGAPDPRVDARPKDLAAVSKGGPKPWSFVPPKAVASPTVKDAAWPKDDLDRYLLAAMEAKGLKPVADADKPALLRRVSFDLVGLPPSPAEVRAFGADTTPDAFAKVVDRLLTSPRFGERWGRHWLDVARFAESSGKANMIYSQAWRYRDWVIAALNADKPYDRFVAEQVAGDLLPAQDAQHRADQLIATGFLAVGSKTHNTQDRRQFVVDLADEQIEATGDAFLGLTIACARCHDHKFDPISQQDYTALSGIFQSTQTRYGTLPGLVQNANPSPLIELPADAQLPSAMPTLTAPRRAEMETQLAGLVEARDALTQEENFTPKGFQTRARLAMLRFRLASYRPDGTPRSYAMGAVERDEPVDSPLYVRGELENPAGPTPRGLIQGLGGKGSISHGSGRLELARWLASRENPLTARVMVNRVWLHLFGQGLVPTPDNFGAAGQPPSHPELLDTLAVSFMDGGWSVKSLIRRVVLSRAYQLSSVYDSRNFEVDPDDTLNWRMSPRRIEAEALRDAVLAVSGTLNLDPPVGSAVGVAGEGFAGPARGFSRDEPFRQRAVYLPVVRDQLPESLALFDFADPSLVTGERSTTSGPTQALYLMNSPFVIRQAEAAATRLMAAEGDDTPRIVAAYLSFLGREPTDAERERALGFLSSFGPSGEPMGSKAAWTALCQALYASAEFRYLN